MLVDKNERLATLRKLRREGEIEEEDLVRVKAKRGKLAVRLRRPAAERLFETSKVSWWAENLDELPARSEGAVGAWRRCGCLPAGSAF